MLEAGESVELVSWGIEYAFLEACFLGIWHYVLNRRALVFTDRRMLLLQIDGRRRLRELKFAVPYAAIRGFVKGGLGYFGLVLAVAPLLLQPTPDVETAATVAGALVGGLHAPDAWITRRTGRKGLYPAR